MKHISSMRNRAKAIMTVTVIITQPLGPLLCQRKKTDYEKKRKEKTHTYMPCCCADGKIMIMSQSIGHVALHKVKRMFVTHE